MKLYEKYLLTEEWEIPYKSGKRTFTTKIAPKDRTYKNIPKDSKGNHRCRFQDWLQLKGNPSKGCNGKWYGWSHRAIHGFGVGDVIKPGTIGNKYQYSDEANKEYIKIMNKDGYEEADKYLDSLGKFEPYKIKTDEEAKEHANRFKKDVS